MLNDSSRLEKRGHHGIVASNIDNGSISKEGIRVAPHAFRILVSEVFHPLSTVFAILLFGVGRPSDEELNLELELVK